MPWSLEMEILPNHLLLKNSSGRHVQVTSQDSVSKFQKGRETGTVAPCESIRFNPQY